MMPKLGFCEKCITDQVSIYKIVKRIKDQSKSFLREAIITILAVLFKENLNKSKSIDGLNSYFLVISEVEVKTHFMQSLFFVLKVACVPSVKLWNLKLISPPTAIIQYKNWMS